MALNLVNAKLSERLGLVLVVALGGGTHIATFSDAVVRVYILASVLGTELGLSSFGLDICYIYMYMYTFCVACTQVIF